jgi:serine/threonine-protein kinase
MEDLTGRQFGPYQIVAPVGEGGMAAVYKAYQPSMERYVALKVLPRQMAQSEEFIARFKREARLLAQLQHPHILSVFDYGEADGFTYIAMPLVQSGTLADLLKTRRVSLPEIRRIITQIGDALGYAHARGIIHRDIKPSNVLVDERGNCLLTDFGLARMAVATSMLTSSGAIMGTPAYMSPEQGTGGTVDGRSDIYSLGIILYEMVTGRVPYSAETPIAIVFKHIQDPLPPARNIIPDLSEALELVLLKSLAKTPDDRYQSAEEFVHAIQEAIPFTSAVTPALRAGAPTTPPPPVVTPVSQPPAAQAQPNANLPTMMEPVSKPPSTPPVAAPASYTPPSQPSYRPVSQPQIQPAKKGLPLWTLAGVGIVGLGLVGILALVFGLNYLRNNAAAPSPTDIPPATTTSNTPEIAIPTTAAPGLAIEIIDGNSFWDDFNDEMAEDWRWEAEDPAKWSLTIEPGVLQILTTETGLENSGIPTNLLLRDAPQGDFEMTTLMWFVPSSNFEFAGLVVFDSAGNAMQFGRAYCDLPGTCIGNGLYFDNYENSSFTSDNFKTLFRAEDVFLRLRRTGNTYTASYSVDGEKWTILGQHTRDFQSARVGLLAAQSDKETPAEFDYFTVNELPRAAANTNAECFSRPQENAEVVAVFQAGQTTRIDGTTADSDWLLIENPENVDETCWIRLEQRDLGSSAALIPIIDPEQTALELPSPPTVVVPTGEKFVRINNITVNAQNQYMVEYETFEYTETLPGTHVHFFFNTVPVEQAGVPGNGPWKLYGGPRPFTGYRTSDRPQNASQLCALVANPNHSVIAESGHCFPLPDVPTATARVDTACLNTPSDSGATVITFQAGATALLKGFSSDLAWLSIQNPVRVDASTCWVPFDSSLLGGDVGQVPTLP